MKWNIYISWVILMALLVVGCNSGEQLPSTSLPTIELPTTLIPIPTATSEPEPTATPTLQPDNFLTQDNIHRISLLEDFSFGSDWISTIAWSSDNAQLAWGTARGAVYIWQLPDKDSIKTLLQTGPAVNSIRWSPDNSKLAVTTFAGRAHIFEVDTGAETLMMSGISRINEVSWVDDETRIAIGKEDGTIEIWGIESNHLLFTLQGHTNKVLSVAWSRDGSQLVSGSEDGTVRLWDVENEQELQNLAEPHSGVNAVSWSPDGSYVASGSSLNGETIIWDLASNQPIANFKADTSGPINQLAWSSDLQLLAATTNGSKVQMWRTSDGSEIVVSNWISVEAVSIGWSLNGELIATGDKAGNLKLWGISN